jgi:uncharacterized Fe-S cluster protein YjdI
MKEIIKRYTKDKLTVVWQPAKCTHSKNCFHGLPDVFNPQNRPWVKLDSSTKEDIIAQVKKCPSGALSIENQFEEETNMKNENATKINVSKGGPLLVEGDLIISLPNGEKVEKKGMTALCRCGASANKPYCDGSHNKIEFDS